MSIFAMAKVLGQKMFGKTMIIVTSAQDGKSYSGTLLDVLEKDGHFYAAQRIGDNHIILHNADPSGLQTLNALIGQEVEMMSDNGGIQNVADPRSRTGQRNKGWNR